MPYADYVFISKDFAIYKGCNSKEDAVKYFVTKIKEG